jgi:hypothetical protein
MHLGWNSNVALRKIRIEIRKALKKRIKLGTRAVSPSKMAEFSKGPGVKKSGLRLNFTFSRRNGSFS